MYLHTETERVGTTLTAEVMSVCTCTPKQKESGRPSRRCTAHYGHSTSAYAERKRRKATKHAPCPFCGSTHVRIDESSFAVACDLCGALGPNCFPEDHPGDYTAALWNAWDERSVT